MHAALCKSRKAEKEEEKVYRASIRGHVLGVEMVLNLGELNIVAVHHVSSESGVKSGDDLPGEDAFS